MLAAILIVYVVMVATFKSLVLAEHGAALADEVEAWLADWATVEARQQGRSPSR